MKRAFSWNLRPRGVILAATTGLLALTVADIACGPGGDYTRLPSGAAGGDSGLGGMDTSTGGNASGGAGGGGMGGSLVATGGAGGGGLGGRASTGGEGGGGKGGSGAAGSAGLGGKAGAAGGTASGGAAGAPVGGAGGSGKGGTGTGGVATGGAGGGGKPGTGGAATGGSAVGGGGAGGRGGFGGAMATILSIDFVGGVVSTGGAGGRTMTVQMGPTEVAGVRPAANWNAAVGSASSAALTPLKLSDGTSIAASLTWSALGTATSSGTFSVGLTDAPGDARMMNGYLDPAMGTLPSATVTVSGLPSTLGSYDVYVYYMGKLLAGDTRTHTLTVVTPAPNSASTSFTASQTGPAPTTLPPYVQATAANENYVIFRKVKGPSFTLTSTAVTGGTKRAPVNGFQIVWPAAP